VNILQSMTLRIPQLMQQSQLESSEGLFTHHASSFGVLMLFLTFHAAWSAYWLPIFNALTRNSTNPCREVRHLAFSSLQRTLLSPELTHSDSKEWTAIFGKVLFPLIHRLLKPEVFSTDRDGMSEMRVQASSLMCKVFLQYLVLLSEWEGMLDLWVKIIDIMDRLLNSGQGDSLVSVCCRRRLLLRPTNAYFQEEAVRENLKNVILFMSSSGYLISPKLDPSKERIWNETWKRIDRFLPDLRADLALEDPEPEENAKKEEVEEKKHEASNHKPGDDDAEDEEEEDEEARKGKEKKTNETHENDVD
jgi:golgi-specific brefeldin A-resistance guanine nucleotide exchange factor 1